MKSIHASNIDGTITAPPSKSHMIRALAGGLLSEGLTVIRNYSTCDDSLTAIEIIKSLGAEVEIMNNSIIIRGGLNPNSDILLCNESALCARMFSAIAPLTNKPICIEGNGSLLSRDLSDVVDNLIAMGVQCESNNGRLPFIIKGKYKNSEIELNSYRSSQFMSGLLFALPLLPYDSVIKSRWLSSRPYVLMTIETLIHFGIEIEIKNFREVNIKGKQKYKPFNFTVEGDWSNAAFLLVAGAIAGNIQVEGLDFSSSQGDINIIGILIYSGAKITKKGNGINIQKSELNSFIYDASDTPDLVPPLVALACCCKGISLIKGVNRLVYKESNRLKSLVSEFSKLGVNIYSIGNALYVDPDKINGGAVDSCNDHRIAMALAIAGLVSLKPVEIFNTDCVRKSYPEFFNDLKKIGGLIYE